MPRKTPASPAVHFMMPPRLAEDFREACDDAGRSLEDVFRQYLGHIAAGTRDALNTVWPDSEYPGNNGAHLVVRPPRELVDAVRELAASTRVKASDWYRLAVWRAVQARAAPADALAQPAEVAS